MEEGSEVLETDTKYEQYTYRTIRYCQKYAKKCIKLGIPAPFAAEMTRNASQTLKVTILSYISDVGCFFSA